MESNNVKGYRVTALDKYGNIRSELGERHHFSTSQERSIFWANLLPSLIGDERVPDASKMALFGYAIIEVEATDVVKDELVGSDEDYNGIIISAKLIDENINFGHCEPDSRS